MIRVLSTRPLEASLKELAAARGIIIDELPFIKTSSLQDEALITKLNELSRLPITVALTSMNAVEAITAQMDGVTDPLKDAKRVPWKIFSIGSATRELTEKYFGKEAIAGTAPSAAALAEEMLRQKASLQDEIFFFCGDQRRDELPEILRQGGIKVNEIIVYRTEQTPHTITEPYDGVVFFSPSAVHSFFSVNKVAATTVLFAIGSTTASAIGAYSTGRIIAAAAPEKAMLINQVIDHFQTRL